MRLELPTNRFYLGRDYSEAIEAAGGVPLHICLIPRLDYIQSVVEGLDGLLLPGSDSDVDPLRFGHQPHPQLGTVQPLKDETDLLAIAAAEQKGIPILAICFGLQVLNVSRGGTLIQDINSEVSAPVKHEQGAPRDRHSHEVRLKEGSIVADFAHSERLHVNSHHHQAVKTLGENLVATAWSSDGIVEAIEDPRPDRFIVGVQWHPELGWDHDGFSQTLFSHFVTHARSFDQLTNTKG